MLRTFSSYSEFKIDAYSEAIPFLKILLLIPAIGKSHSMKGHRFAPNSVDIKHAPARFETTPNRGYELQFSEFLR
jgi:hypothetical protein